MKAIMEALLGPPFHVHGCCVCYRISLENVQENAEVIELVNETIGEVIVERTATW